MKKTAIAIYLLAAVICITAVLFSAPVNKGITVAPETKENVINLSDKSSAYIRNKTIEKRFLNMLNHSFVYDEDIEDIEEIVNCSVAALLDMRDSEDDSFISESVVSDFVFNMYGVEIDDFSLINSELPQKEGYVYILPRGYSVYSHELVSVSVNEDGSYTVKTKVTVDSHDCDAESFACTTLFVANPHSQFGYNIISSSILNGDIML